MMICNSGTSHFIRGFQLDPGDGTYNNIHDLHDKNFILIIEVHLEDKLQFYLHFIKQVKVHTFPK